MIFTIKGMVTWVSEDMCGIEVQGVGVLLYVLRKEVFVVGDTVNLYTYFYWHQEQGPTLYGFVSMLERELFILLIGCSGVGPKMGMQIVGQLGSELLVQALYEENTDALSSVSGVGKKRAEQIILNLRGKAALFIERIGASTLSETSTVVHEVKQALAALAYTQSEVSQAVRYVMQKSDHDIQETKTVSFDLFMRKALAFLSKNRTL
ncbi:MAG: Holliday junction branch migration protein RuvA [Candidatus Babeliales bacterium]